LSLSGFDPSARGELFKIRLRIISTPAAIRGSDWRCGVVDDDVQSIERSKAGQMCRRRFQGVCIRNVSLCGLAVDFGRPDLVGSIEVTSAIPKVRFLTQAAV
jgi:hypothetical protein